MGQGEREIDGEERQNNRVSICILDFTFNPNVQRLQDSLRVFEKISETDWSQICLKKVIPLGLSACSFSKLRTLKSALCSSVRLVVSGRARRCSNRTYV